MQPAVDSPPEQLQFLQSLSSDNLGLVVPLPNHQQLVLCPEGDSAAGTLSIVAVLAKQPLPPPAAAAAGAGC